tara:strand:+ start:204 stop:1250 length:1047 start_codon:yes stop_codon:yes gene_type:complete
MIRNSDIADIEEKLSKLPRDKVHKLLLLHLSGFSDFFLNIASYGDEVEKTLGTRVNAKTLAPLSFTILNTIIYSYHDENAPYHKEIIKLNLPIDDFKHHPLHKFEFSYQSKRFSKNTIECISYNTSYPKETVRRQLKPWIKIGAILKNKKIGYYAPFQIIFETDLFKKTHFWIAEKMGKNWSDHLQSISHLGYLPKSYTIDTNKLKNRDKNYYFRTWVMLHWYWSLCFRYIDNSPLTYNECCILSSSLFFNKNFQNKMSSEKLDFYSEGVIRPVNLNSIAESSLIPRESVRRIVNSLINKNILRKDKNKIYVTEFVTTPKFLITSSNKTLRCMLHDILIIIVNIFNPD